MHIEASLKRWFVEDHPAQPHLWEDDRTVAEWLDGQLDPTTKSVCQVKRLFCMIFSALIVKISAMVHNFLIYEESF